ncbi:acetyl-CoA carboxylase biotin carboxyl carrier protein [Halalkalibacterium ligniniphilum]|uniref:acetyl-CoA carboxylase biotin carboxyl carrier protein n=2 Tax=Halalkalibacterium ligniniphilum TaxID=1134413 RepID=UPI00034B777E|nr:acetyl-CoA carboxylase biotin carboxyl carrier protein [Halalkalibacterium ligniniphilum]
MKIQEIRELIRAVDQSSLDEFKFEQDGLKLVLKKYKEAEAQVQQVANAATSQSQPTASPPLAPPVQESVQPTPVETPKVSEAPKTEATNVHKITSPMVGTFYAAPSPDSDPYVKVGDQVDEGSVVCIVEAMKLMNEIEAEVNGKIVEILVENGELVEYGQPLFVVEPQK